MSTKNLKYEYGQASKLPNYLCWTALESAFKGIFDSQYYTENGPLVRQLEAQLRERKAAPHVVAVMNEFVAYLMLLDSLPGSGELLVHAAPSTLTCALEWLPQWSAVECSSLEVLLKKIDYRTGAVVADASFCCDIKAFKIQQALQQAGAGPLILNCSRQPLRPLAGCDAHIWSMQTGFPIGALEGGCIALSDMDWADRMRTMRSSSGAPRKMTVKKTVNGRLSEAHAALALLWLEGQATPSS